MRTLLVLADAEGKIKTAVSVDPPNLQHRSPANLPESRNDVDVAPIMDVKADDGDKLYRITLPEELQRYTSFPSLGEYVVRVEGGEARLVKRLQED
ncbi:hypothetical protein [Streptomyces sp. NPDC050585]|uniref:hypothetical protein n=1 Tax=Streptomyces sp. NPDC050585 TaxID=3365632 RepID=UPI0037AFB579